LNKLQLAARIALLTLPALALAACAGDEPDSTLTRRVDAVFAPLVEAHEFSGAVVLLRGGEVVYQRGFGSANHDARIPFTPETPGDGGSLAKTLTAAGIWWLAQEGRIKLDAPATDYVPGYPHPGTTVRQLIAHSNGLPWDYAAFDQHFAPDQPRTTESMLEIVARHFPQPRFQPGTLFEYSSFGYDVAALAIEKASGQSYEEFLDERFFAKLGMEQSFVRPGRLRTGRARERWATAGVMAPGCLSMSSTWKRFGAAPTSISQPPISGAGARRTRREPRCRRPCTKQASAAPKWPGSPPA
jgi:CubicO group peptidase (beta-lactamase class C family)